MPLAPIIADEIGKSVPFEIVSIVTVTCEYVFQDNAEGDMQKDPLFHYCPGL